jgi:N-acetylmuramic acid 6-phosphate etherase
MTPPCRLPGTEISSARYDGIESWSPTAILSALWESQLAAVASVQAALPAIAAAAEACALLLPQGGRLVYAGAGTSGRVGAQDGAELPPTFGWPTERLVLLIAGGEAALTRAIENAEDDEDAARTAVRQHHIGERDVVIGIAASGGTPFTLACLQESGARGACTIALANSPDGAILKAARFPILVETGAEAIAGSTRLKAGTAQKVVLNLLSTLVMIRLGHVHRGLMVDMQARNEKLRGRAERMLAQLTGAEPEAIAAALAATSGRVKPAVLVLHGLDADQAEAALGRHGGMLRAALAEIGA